MTKQVRVNVMALANTAAIRREKRDGRDKIIVPSATLPDDVIMNGSGGKIRYPADEIAKSYMTLNDTVAPLRHPLVNGKFVSAKSGAGLAIGYVGVTNENVRRENGRVFMDKVIDEARAKESEGGKRILNAIEKGEPIHTSTGLLANLEPAPEGVDYTYIAKDIVFDHDAILLDEQGAATPEQGVGMMVNSEGEEIEVINSALDEADRDLYWAAEQAVRAVEKAERAPMIERLMTAIKEAVSGSERETSTNNKENDMSVSKEQFDALSAKVDTLSESIKPEALANAMKEAVKPLTDNMEALQNAQKAKDDAELEGLCTKIVKANLMDEATAKELTLNAARKLADTIKDGKAAPLNASFTGTTEANGFKLPKAEA